MKKYVFEGLEPKPKNHYLPKTITEAIQMLGRDLNITDKEHIRSLKREELKKLHHGFEDFIINEFGLLKGNEALILNTGEEHPEDAAFIIILKFWESLQ